MVEFLFISNNSNMRNLGSLHRRTRAQLAAESEGHRVSLDKSAISSFEICMRTVTEEGWVMERGFDQALEAVAMEIDWSECLRRSPTGWKNHIEAFFAGGFESDLREFMCRVGEKTLDNGRM